MKKVWSRLGTRTIRVTWYERAEVDGAAPGDFSRGFTSIHHYTEERVSIEVDEDQLRAKMIERASKAKGRRATFQGGLVVYNGLRGVLTIDWERIASRLASQCVVYSKGGRAVRCGGFLRAVWTASPDPDKTNAARAAVKIADARYQAWRRTR